MRVTLTIEDKLLASVLDGAGSRYWCAGLDWPPLKPVIRLQGRGADVSCWEALLAGAIPFVTVEEDRSEEGEANRLHRVTRTRIAIAFDIMAREHPKTLGECCSELGHDANTGDVLLQLAALGEVRYG
jgi:hypothetical protein